MLSHSTDACCHFALAQVQALRRQVHALGAPGRPRLPRPGALPLLPPLPLLPLLPSLLLTLRSHDKANPYTHWGTPVQRYNNDDDNDNAKQ